MKLVSFYTRGETHLGVRLEQGILDISDTLKVFPEEGVPGQLSEILVA